MSMSDQYPAWRECTLQFRLRSLRIGDTVGGKSSCLSNAPISSRNVRFVSRHPSGDVGCKKRTGARKSLLCHTLSRRMSPANSAANVPTLHGSLGRCWTTGNLCEGLVPSTLRISKPAGQGAPWGDSLTRGLPPAVGEELPRRPVMNYRVKPLVEQTQLLLGCETDFRETRIGTGDHLTHPTPREMIHGLPDLRAHNVYSLSVPELQDDLHGR